MAQLGGPYQRRLAEVYRFAVPGLKVLGWAAGGELRRPKPALGSAPTSLEMLRRAKARHPRAALPAGDAQTLRLHQRFDVIILSDLVVICGCPNRSGKWRAWSTPLADHPQQLQPIVGTPCPWPSGWGWPASAAELVHHGRPDRSSAIDRIDPIRSWPEVLLPLKIHGWPLWPTVFVRFWPFHHLALTNFDRPPLPQAVRAPPTVGVIVPARNRAGNITHLPIGACQPPGCELIFVEGHSRDDTYEAILQQSQAQPHVRTDSSSRPGSARAASAPVRAGHRRDPAILDADLSVAGRPAAIHRGADGRQSRPGQQRRLVYPMEKAMRYLDLLGNKLFGFGFSWLLGQKVRDTLCGTKVLWRSDYQRIAANRAHFGDFDPFGDFDLLFGAARLNLKILDLPIRYHRREYGETNIERWRHGWLLLRMLFFAMRRLKFM
jgi:hypothetical protein